MQAPNAASVHRNPRQRYVTNAFRPLVAARAGRIGITDLPARQAEFLIIR
jgi:hypothetical protein